MSASAAKSSGWKENKKAKSFAPADEQSSDYSSYDEENENNNDNESDEDENDDDEEYEDEEGSENDNTDNYYDDDEEEEENSDRDGPEEESSSMKSKPVVSSSKAVPNTANKPTSQVPKINPNVPLYRLLAKQQKQKDDEVVEDAGRPRRKRKLAAGERQELYKKNRDSDDDDHFDDDDSDDDGHIKKKKKHAPAEMRSDKPVRRLRIDSNAQKPKVVDPRFLDYTGELSHSHYSKNYEFLDQMRENEVQALSKKLRKSKGAKREQLSQELNTFKQQLNERKLGKKVMERIEAFKRDDRDKIKQGLKHTPYFLKKSDKKRLAAEEKYAQLKETGKVHRYLQKKERKQQAAINQSIPTRRNI
jgi:ribosomal RNA-processing protein 36